METDAAVRRQLDKEIDPETMRDRLLAEARAMTPEVAAEQARSDYRDFREALELNNAAGEWEASAQSRDMAARAEANPSYSAELKNISPDAHQQVMERAQDRGPTIYPARNISNTIEQGDRQAQLDLSTEEAAIARYGRRARAESYADELEQAAARMEARKLAEINARLDAESAQIKQMTAWPADAALSYRLEAQGREAVEFSTAREAGEGFHAANATLRPSVKQIARVNGDEIGTREVARTETTQLPGQEVQFEKWAMRAEAPELAEVVGELQARDKNILAELSTGMSQEARQQRIAAYLAEQEQAIKALEAREDTLAYTVAERLHQQDWIAQSNIDTKLNQDLERLATIAPERAGRIWQEAAPADAQSPEYLSAVAVDEQAVQAARRAANLDAEALKEMRSPKALDDAAEMIAARMRDPAYAAELIKHHAPVAKGVQTLAHDGAEFDADVARRADVSITDIHQNILLAARTRDREEALRLLNGNAQPWTREVLEAKSKEDSLARETEYDTKRAGKVLETEEVPLNVQRRYLRHNNHYYLREEGNKLAFSDLGKALDTTSNDPEIAKSMVSMAQAKGWTAMKLTGADEFKREAWLEASLNGIQVDGYKPQEADLARLADALKSRPQETQKAAPAKNAIEFVEREQEKPKAPEVAEQPAQLNLAHAQSVEALKQIVRAQGGDEHAVSLVAAEAAKRVYMGKVIEHGAAPYEHKKENDQSYYIKLQTPAGEKTVWGADLERVAGEGKLSAGEQIALSEEGRKPVTIQKKVTDEQGRVKHVDATVHRNAWRADRVDELDADKRKRLEARASITSATQALRTYDHTAQPAPRQIAKPTQERHSDRSRA